MITEADLTAAPQLPVWVLPILLLIAAVILFARGLPRRPTPAATKTVTPLHREQCSTTGCGFPARVLVDSFVGLVVVCHGCADEGIAHGWFTAA